MICSVQKGNRFVVILVATYLEIDSVNFKDANLVVMLVATYSQLDRVKFIDASL